MKWKLQPIQDLFDRFAKLDIICVGIHDTRTNTNRFWEFTSTHVNMWHPQAVFTRDGTVFHTLEEFLQYAQMRNVIVYNEPLVSIKTAEPQPICPDVWEEYLISVERRREMYQSYIDLITIEEHEPSRWILIVGNHEEATMYAHVFESFDWQVDLLPTQLMSQRTEPYYLHKIEYDHILILQNYDAIQIKQNLFPVHFYAKQGAQPNLPLNWNGNMGIFFHAYLGAPEQWQTCYGTAWNQTKHVTEFVPHGWHPQLFQSRTSYKWENRPRSFGWMGTLTSLPHPYDIERRDYLSVHMYDLRNQIVPFAKKECGCDVLPKSRYAEYVQFLHETQFVLNVGPIFGLVNERQFHAMGCGAVLVQNRYKHLDSLGYKHRENCLLFDDPADLAEQMEWAYSHLTACKKIAQKGKELANQYTLKQMVKRMIRAMIKWEMYLNEQ